MKTMVYQSYRTYNVPEWIARCMETVKHWAQQNGFDYDFVDDRLFEYVPDWYRHKVNDNIYLVSDLARLELAKEYLDRGYDRTIWVDADVVVFDADNFAVNVVTEFAFCREAWFDRRANGEMFFDWGINNSITVFTKYNSMLDFYIYACKSLVRNRSGEIGKLAVGTNFLSDLYRHVYFPLLTNVGLFSKAVLVSLATGREEYAKTYIREFGYPVQAANLCSSQRNADFDGVIIDDNLFHVVVEKLIKTKGSIMNQYLLLR